MKSILFGTISRRRSKNHHPTLFDRHPGQAIVLIAIMMVVLIAFTGLALDGGELYFLKRDVQNAADSAVIAALYQWCGYPHDPGYVRDLRITEGKSLTQNNDGTWSLPVIPWPPAVRDQMDGNGFTQTSPAITSQYAPSAPYTLYTSSDPNVTWSYQRPSAPPGGGTLDPNLLTITLTVKKPARLIQVVYNGPLQASATVVGRCVAASTWTQGHAIMGMGTNCSNAVDYTGSNGHIEGGTWSNSGTRLQNTDVDGGADSVGSVSDNPQTHYTNPSSPQPGQQPLVAPTFWSMADFDFSPVGNIADFAKHIHTTDNWSTYTYDPANASPPNAYHYFNGTATSWSDFGVTVNSSSPNPPKGIYYASGGITLGVTDFKFGPVKTTDMTKITLVSPGVIDVNMNNGQALTISPFPILGDPNDDTTPLGAWEAAHIHQTIPTKLPTIFTTHGTQSCANNDYGIKITGTFQWLGAIYAPYGTIYVSTDATGTSNGALMGWMVTVSGSSMTVKYDPDTFPPLPPDINIVSP